MKMRMNGIQYFEAAARLGGFKKASEELNITPAAVSHQIKQLEDNIGVALFLRKGKGVQLTVEGKVLFEDVTKGIGSIEGGINRVKDHRLRGTLSVNVAPSLASFWLVSKIGDFQKIYPQIELRIFSKEEPPDLYYSEIDIRLTHSKGYFPNLYSRQLFTEYITPICAPGILCDKPIQTFADLRDHYLIHDVNIGEEEPNMCWDRWLLDKSCDSGEFFKHIYFDSAILAIKAACAGHGVALGRSMLVQDLLHEGALVRPLPEKVRGDRAYYYVVTHQSAEKLRVRVFLDWLEAIAGVYRKTKV